MEGQSLKVIMLAGGLRASAFRQQLGIPTLKLPLGRHPSLLDAWLTSIMTIEIPVDVQIVVSWDEDVRHLNPLVNQRLEKFVGESTNIKLSTDPSPWRGTGGLVYDVVSHMNDDDIILVVESSCLPPPSLSSVVKKLDRTVSGLVCCSSNYEPAGMYLFRKSALEVIPKEGFFDLKEQLLPCLHQNGQRMLPLVVFDKAVRVSDRNSYLRTVHGFLNGTGAPEPDVSPEAHVASSAKLLGACVIEEGVTIESEAIVHESVILKGATIGRKALVSRSIVGGGARVDSDNFVRDSVVPFNPDVTGQGRNRHVLKHVAQDRNDPVEVGA